MTNIADVSPLIGRSYVTKSNNVALVSSLGDGALRVNWRWVESEADRKEFNDWVTSVLAIPLNITISVGKESETANLQEWKQR